MGASISVGVCALHKLDWALVNPRISIIVPTLNEAENLPLLLPRISEAMPLPDWEVVIVDDSSTDNTPQVCSELAVSFPLRLIVREQPRHGLSGAVLHGIAQSHGEVIVVMDADLQHPPEKIPELVSAVTEGDADFAIGSRYAGGSMEGNWGAFRRLNSWVATALARPFSGGIKDPMSGFFAMRRQTLARACRLSPLGYKIALELMCKCRLQKVAEVPIHFGTRARGQSKLSLKQQFHYLQHLSRLYDFTFPRAAPMAKFAIVLALGAIIATGVFASLMPLGAPAFAAVLIAYLAHVLVTALFHVRYVRTQREFLVTRRPWLDFGLISLGELAAAAGVAHWVLQRVPDAAPLEVLAIAFLAGTVTRYVLRKELMQDVRGLRQEFRAAEIQ